MLHFGDVCFEPVERKDHVSHLVKFGNEGGLQEYRLSKRKTCTSEQEFNIENVHSRDNYFLYVICAPTSKNRVGISEIYDISWVDKTCKLHLWLTDRAEMVPRFGTKALNISLNYIFNSLGLNRVSADVLHEDVVMSSLYKKHGFRQEVRKRNHMFSRGAYISIMEMGLLSSEFEIIA